MIMKRIITCLIIVTMMFGLMSQRALAAKDSDVKSVYKLTSATEIKDTNRDYLIIVNDQRPYEFGGFYDINLRDDLVYFPNVVDGDIMAVEKATYLAFTMLQRDLKKEGIEIGLYDGYRTADDQQFLIDIMGSSMQKVVQPGYSEHHTGLVLDIVVWSNAEDANYAWYSESAERSKTMPVFKRVHEKMVDYGFIDRYPEGKEYITGMPYIPYEIRYVGSPEIAHAISDNGLCLEEYVKSLQ